MNECENGGVEKIRMAGGNGAGWSRRKREKGRRRKDEETREEARGGKGGRDRGSEAEGRI